MEGMEDKLITRSFKNYFTNHPEKSGKILSVFNQAKCYIQTLDSPEIKIFPYFCQLWAGRDETTLEENLICAVLWQRLIQNKLTYKVQESPHCFRDDQIKENKELVQSYITNVHDSKIIRADFWGGTQGEDGQIEFSEPPLKENKIFPLELGYIRPSQFYYHIFYKKCIARIPYDSDYIIYFEDLDIGNII